MYSAFPFIMMWECVYFILLSSSDRKYDLVTIVYGQVMKPLYALYVFL